MRLLLSRLNTLLPLWFVVIANYRIHTVRIAPAGSWHGDNVDVAS